MRLNREVRRAVRLAAVVVLGAVSACSDSSTTSPQPVDIRDVEFHSSLGVDLDAMVMTESGLFYEDLIVGDGDPAEIGDEVSIHYTVWFSNGAEFDTSTDGDPPLNFTIGSNRYIPGFEEGAVGMRVGGTRLLAVPWQLAYGAGGLPGVVPPFANLVFEIELTSLVKAEES